VETHKSFETLIDIVSPKPLAGDQVGFCFICIGYCKKGNEIKKIVSSNFTNYSQLSTGDLICCRCTRMLKDAKYRRSNWIASRGSFVSFKAHEFTQVLENVKVPFVAFVTRSYKKHGFLHGIFSTNYSKDRVSVIFEDRVIRFTRHYLDNIYSLLAPLVKILGKRRVSNWDIAAHHLEKVVESGLMDNYRAIEAIRRSEIFDFAIHTLPRTKK